MADDGPLMQPVIRQRPENHTPTAPHCDERCARWGVLPHAHICPDGLLEDHPYLDITAWCSCGKRLGYPEHVSVEEATEVYRARLEAAGQAFALSFDAHMVHVHNIDIHTDPAWLRALGTAP